MFRDPGRLRHRIRLERPVRQPDGAGGASVSFETVDHVWAFIEPRPVRPELIAGQIDERQRSRVLMRYRSDVGSGWQLVHGDRTMSVESVHDPDERRAWIACVVEEDGR